MTYGCQFIKLTWMFEIKGTDEIADTTVNYIGGPTFDNAVATLAEVGTSAVAESIIGRMATFLNSTPMQWAAYSQITGLKMAAIGVDGHYLTDPFIEETPPGSTGTVQQIIPQSTVVLSLRSGFTFGKGNYGRMYLPHTKCDLPTGQALLSVSEALDAANAGKTFLNHVTDDLNAAATAILFPAIMSQSTGLSRRGVTQVGVGRVIDTQRRRRNRLDDSAQIVPLA